MGTVLSLVKTEDRKCGRYVHSASRDPVADAEISESGNIFHVAGFVQDTVEAVGEVVKNPLDSDMVASQ